MLTKYKLPLLFMVLVALAVISGMLSANILKTVSVKSKSRSKTITKKITNKLPLYQVVKASKLGRGVQRNYHADHLAGNMGLPDVSETKIRITNNIIHKGEFFSIFVDLYDSSGRQRIKGGDFLFAKLSINGTRSAGKIIDFDNGTYEVIYFASHEGIVQPNILLVHPQEAVDYLENKLWPIEGRVYWRATFTSKGQQEQTLCMLKKGGSWKNKCEYTYPEALGGIMFICDKPKTLPCDSLKFTNTARDIVAENFKNTSHEVLNYFAKEVQYAAITYISSIPIIVKSAENPLVNRPLLESIDLPVCKGMIPSPLSDGFWTGDVWHSLVCKTKQWSPSEIRRCVRGKHLVLMGDSTTRQWGEVLLKTLELSTKHVHFQHITERSDTLNLTFYFHPFMLGSSKNDLTKLTFDVDILNGLVGCDYYIVISPWAHYTQWARDSYKERLQLLKVETADDVCVH
ncbi:NXPE family member 4-like [Antedon mediterranea]|uniref:NXPE family member 4-like n=1 Tax=Antedon mediterranea TaxID=105859 RepID=UPI003AF6582B